MTLTRLPQAVVAELPPGHDEAGTRERILLASMAMFAEHGYHGASLRDIGQASGIRAASIYEHFASKEEILARLATIGHELLLDRLRHALLEAGRDPRHQVHALVAADVMAHGEYPVLAVVIETELHALSPERAAPVLALRQQLQLLALDVINRGIDQDLLHPHNVVATLAAIGGMALRVPYWFTPSPDYPLEQLATDYADLALVMLHAQP